MSITETTTVKKKREQVAEHSLLLVDGQEAESEEKASGIRYKLLENGKVFEWQWGEANEDERRMIALFGAKTLATNVTSAARNNEKNPADADGQMGEIIDRFSLIRSGQWIDSTREPGAPRIDRDALAKAIVQVMLSESKITPEQAEPTFTARRARLDSDPAYLAGVRTHTKVAEAYNALVGRKTISSEDL